MTNPLTVVCLCATWCLTCEAYKATFREAAAAHPDALFRWVDIEDEADIAGDLDIENFPTLLVLRDRAPVFYGVLTPQPEIIRSLLGSVAAGRLAACKLPPEVLALVDAIQLAPEVR